MGVGAAIAFLAMAVVSEARLRPLPLVTGGVIVGALILLAAWLAMQKKKYGRATLIAVTPFSFGSRLEGWIDSELPAVPEASLSIRLYGWNGRNFLPIAREDVSPERIERLGAGTIRIPFSILVPDKEWVQQSIPARLTLRTSNWPIGWGATFRIRSSDKPSWWAYP